MTCSLSCNQMDYTQQYKNVVGNIVLYTYFKLITKFVSFGNYIRNQRMQDIRIGEKDKMTSLWRHNVINAVIDVMVTEHLKDSAPLFHNMSFQTFMKIKEYIQYIS